MYHIFCIHSLVAGQLGCFQFLAIMNKAAMNIVEQVSLWDDGAPLVIGPGVVYLGLEVELVPVF